MSKLALRIEVNTLRGAREGLPRLVEALRQAGAGATFVLALGPDRSGLALARGLPRDWLPRPAGSFAGRHYGAAALARGVLWPAAGIGEACGEALRALRDAGFETAMQAWDRWRWLARVEGARNPWTEQELQRAREGYERVFGEAPLAHGAPGWRMNRHALRLTQRLGLAYSSDTRGRCPFIPLWQAEIVACPQIPTTLPTLDETIGHDGCTPETAVERLLARSVNGPLHVFTARAELEGGRLLPQFEALLAGWKEQGRSVVALREVAESLDPGLLPRCAVAPGSVPGRPGKVLLQGAEFLA